MNYFLIRDDPDLLHSPTLFVNRIVVTISICCNNVFPRDTERGVYMTVYVAQRGCRKLEAPVGID